MPEMSIDEAEHVSLCEAVDRILNKGAVIAGEITIAVADIELVKLGLQVVLASSTSLLEGGRDGESAVQEQVWKKK